MPWQISSFPKCTYHVFLSHCGEDRKRLVEPLTESLREIGVIPWGDRHNYAYGKLAFAALRDGVLKCSHTVFLVTPKMLAQRRGWAHIELAWAELLQENLTWREELQAVMLPLFFVAKSDERLPRSVWRTVQERGPFFDPKRSSPRGVGTE